MDRRIFYVVGIAALLLVSPLPVRAWRMVDSRLVPTAIPPLKAVQQQASADFDRDGTPEAVVLAGGRVSIQTGFRSLWQSPETWEVRQVIVADLNRDDLPEAVLLVWRPFRPWRVDEWLPRGGRIQSFRDARGKSCHVILIGWAEGAFRERWAGSALAEPVKEMAAADLDGHGKPYLITLEAQYNDPPGEPARRLKVWEWNGFGFTVVSALDGPFSQIAVGQAESGQILLLAP